VLSHQASSASWERAGLRAALTGLAAPHQVHVFLDRRIDPERQVSGDFPLQPLRGLIESVALRHGIALTTIGNVAYLGPPESARRLRTIDQLRRSEAESLERRLGKGLLARDRLAWPDLATPRELVEEVCRRAQVTLANPDAVPHDLWAGGALVNVPRVTQLTILLAGFDLTFSCDSQGVVTLRPVHPDELWEQSYRVPPGGRRLADEIKSQFPDATFEVDAARVRVTGFIEDHEAIRQWLQTGRPAAEDRPRSNTARQPERRFTMRVVRKPLRDVLRAIEKETELRIAFNDSSKEQAEASLDQLISFEVREVEIDELMKAVLGPLKLDFRRDGTNIEIGIPTR
jgi:hypothetical protein